MFKHVNYILILNCIKKIIMKKSLLLVAFACVFMAFKPIEVYKVDTQKSKIEWVGRKVTGEHKGELKLASGSLNFEGKNFKDGSFVMDMNAMSVTDLQGEMNGKLLGHLKSEDFFSVDKFSTAEFEVTKITPAGAGKVNVTGNLTIKGIKKPITFPAALSIKENVVVAVANGVKVDRTSYNIRYGSKSFFESIGDKAIDDDFELNISLVARK